MPFKSVIKIGFHKAKIHGMELSLVPRSTVASMFIMIALLRRSSRTKQTFSKLECCGGIIWTV